MTRALSVRAEQWPLDRPFTIARGTKTVAEVADADAVGRGEAVPYARYGETVADVVAAVEAMAPAVAAGLDRLALAEAMPAGAARNALDCALWDLEAKQSGQPAWALAGVARPQPVPTAETIALDDPDRMAAAARDLAERPLLKIKVGGEAVVERVAAVRAAAPDARLIVDANEGWDRPLLDSVVDGLAGLGVALIEQPLPAAEDAALAGFASPVPLCADESCHTAADLPRLASIYDVVNVKLDKTGGLTGALELAAAAQAAGFSIMVGCMVATSLAMAPALLLAGGAAFVDLDGPLWLARDRDHALRFDGGLIHPADPQLWG